MDDEILEPLAAYKSSYKERFRQNAQKMYDELVEQSGINVEQNRATVRNYDDQVARSNLTKKQIRSLNTKKGLLIALIVIGALAAFIGVSALLNANYVLGGVALGLGVAAIIVGAVLLAKKINPAIAEAKKTLKGQNAKAEAFLSEARTQMAPLNALFDDVMTKKLIEETIPLIKIDDNFNVRRYDYLSGKYGFGNDDSDNKSTLGILTGEILGNPFVVDRQLIRTMGTMTYEGSLLITWTETHTDSDGHVYVQHCSQTLFATVIKPKPYYSARTRLIYGNDAAPDLHFSRVAAHAEKLDEKELERKIKSGVKKIRDKAEKDGEFTEMGNEEFDVLFGATDRDNEVQFRLLFTPLAQKNMLALLKDGENFGDDFDLRKNGCLNYLSSEHSASWDPDTDPSVYRSHSVDISREKFINFNVSYFHSLFFDLAPLLSIPLYQQLKPKEYIYKEEYPSNFTRYESEYAVNHIGQAAFKPPEAATDCILKTSVCGMTGKSDRVRVTAHAYRAESRVDFVPVWGRDGHLHNVPVPWLEYIPITHESTVMMKELGLSRREFIETTSLTDAIKARGLNTFGYGHKILCCLTGDEIFETESSDENNGSFDTYFDSFINKEK